MADSKNKALPAGTVLRGAVYTYTIEKVLGQGSFGITYLASTLIKGPLGELSMPVAVKEFFAKDLDSRSGDGAVTARTEDGVAYRYAKAFQRESQNLSKMKHPGIVKVLEAFQTNGTYYYSMEYLSGGSLDDKVKGKGIPEAEALPMIKKIGEALAFMHGRKMMHLDLKPKNIMLKADGTPVIIDFGLSKQYDDSGEPESSTTIGLGTPGYAPIEQATQTTSGEFQPTLDIYALGATLFKMLTGKTPPAATLVLNKKATLTPDLQAKNVSSGTIDAIRKAMAPLMDDRPQRVEAFLSMLEGKSVEPEDEAEDETEPKSVPKPTAGHAPAEKPSVILSGREESNGKPKPKTWLLALMGGLAALAVILAFVFGGKGGNQGAGGDPEADTLAVLPVDSIVDTSVSPPVNDLVPEASGSIKITSEPIGATIWLDGKNTMKQTPEVLENVAPGKHAYKLVLDGYKYDSGSITVTSGQRVTLSRMLTVISKEEGITSSNAEPAGDLTPMNEPAPHRFGSLEVYSDPSGAKIWLDGEDTRRTTPSILADIAPGRYTVRLVLDGYLDYNGSVTVSKGQRATLSQTLEEDETVWISYSNDSDFQSSSKVVKMSTLASFINKDVIGKCERITSVSIGVYTSKRDGSPKSNREGNEKVASIIADCFRKKGSVEIEKNSLSVSPFAEDPAKHMVFLSIRLPQDSIEPSAVVQ